MSPKKTVDNAAGRVEIPAPAYDEACSDFLVALAKAIKMTGLYRSGHPIAADAIRDAFNLLDMALVVSRCDQLILSEADERWLCNGAPVFSAAQAPEPLKALFYAHDIGSLNFARGVRPFEIAALCELAAAPPGKSEKGYLEDFLAQRGVKHIRHDASVYSRKQDQQPAPASDAPTASAPAAAPAAAAGASPLSTMSFGNLLKVLVESAVKDPDERVHVYEDAVGLVKDAMDHHVAQATAELQAEKQRILSEQARTETVLSSVADGKVIVDKDGKVLMMNPAAEELAGRPFSEMAGKSITESVNPGEHMVALAQDIGAVNGGNTEVRVVADGEVGRALRRSMAMVQDDAGRVVGTYAALPDVTKFKDMLRLQDEFLSRVTHDLQAPLSSICCALELLNERVGPKLGADEANFLNVSMRNSQQLGGMIRDILDFSKLESGKMAIKAVPTSVCSMLKEATESLQPWAKNKGITLTMRSPQPDLEAHADHKRIVQVLANLISNAIKFTPKGGSIVVGAGLEAKRPDTIVFGVRDTGCGIPRESLQKVFEKFVQVENAAGPKPGVGLGLAIVSEFVKLHGGKVGAKSEVGKGATFYFTLPLAEERAAVPV